MAILAEIAELSPLHGEISDKTFHHPGTGATEGYLTWLVLLAATIGNGNHFCAPMNDETLKYLILPDCSICHTFSLNFGHIISMGRIA
jgi:hypothetical protein